MDSKELTDDLKIWARGKHTVTSLEVQAVKLWAGLMRDVLAQEDSHEARMHSGFLHGPTIQSDEDLAELLMTAKEHAHRHGRAPFSAEPIPQ